MPARIADRGRRRANSGRREGWIGGGGDGRLWGAGDDLAYGPVRRLYEGLSGIGLPGRVCNSCVIRHGKPENGKNGLGKGSIAYRLEIYSETAF
jgi:hypothetical protein